MATLDLTQQFSQQQWGFVAQTTQLAAWSFSHQQHQIPGFPVALIGSTTSGFSSRGMWWKRRVGPGHPAMKIFLLSETEKDDQPASKIFLFKERKDSANWGDRREKGTGSTQLITTIGNRILITKQHHHETALLSNGNAGNSLLLVVYWIPSVDSQQPIPIQAIPGLVPPSLKHW